MPTFVQGLFATLVAVLVLAAPPVAAAGEGDLIVRYRADADASERKDARAQADVTREEVLPVANLEVVDPQAGVATADAIRALERDDDVVYAERDVVRRALRTPDDPYFAYQWGLHNTGQAVGRASGPADADIDAVEAWDVTTGSRSALVAVIDSGITAGHPDLAPNLWVNPGETPGNGVDDDRNGLVDDTSGWDFVENDRVPEDVDGHGTHVAGTVAARGGDAAGLTGVAWQASILPLRTLGDDGSGTVADTIRAYVYAARAGARVVNLSLGGPDTSRAERDALVAAPNALFVAAAGNEGADNDTTPSYPCNHDLPNVVCVAATGRDDTLASFSNYGARTVDLAAPGTSIAATWLDNGYSLLDGTSMATPLVSGTAALLLARDPQASVAALRRALLNGVDPVAALNGRTVTGGRLNARGALDALAGALTVQGGEPDGSEPAPGSGGSSSPAPSGGGSPAASPAPAPAPGPAPAPAPAPAATSPRSAPIMPPDQSAPRLDVSLRNYRRGRVRVRVRCNERCALTLRLRVGTRTVTKRVASKRTPGWVTVNVTSPSRYRGRLLTLRVTGTDLTRNTRTVNRRVRPLR